MFAKLSATLPKFSDGKGSCTDGRQNLPSFRGSLQNLNRKDYDKNDVRTTLLTANSRQKQIEFWKFNLQGLKY